MKNIWQKIIIIKFFDVFKLRQMIYKLKDISNVNSEINFTNRKLKK
jgi:hypothetical protein